MKQKEIVEKLKTGFYVELKTLSNQHWITLKKSSSESTKNVDLSITQLNALFNKNIIVFDKRWNTTITGYGRSTWGFTTIFKYANC